jgi:glucosamine-6-phosphate deaminase
VDGNAADPAAECRRLGELIARHPVDVMFCGIGENGHLAFNDPPANFQTHEAYIIVDLDEACRRQQLGEGWFKSLDEIPTRAISMSINQILKSAVIICSVPDERKAAAVKAAVEGPVTPDVPASILQRHEQCYLLLDEAAASRLGR